MQIGFAHEAVRVGAHEQRQIGLLGDVGGVVQLLGDDHLRGAERQRRVGARARVQPQIGVDGAVVQVGAIATISAPR